MSFSDDVLMAYADGELDQATRHAIEEAMQRDAGLAERVARFKLTHAGSSEAAQGRRRQPQHQAIVVQLAAVRARKEASQQAARRARHLWRWSWPVWTALLLTLALGMLAGRYGLMWLQTDAVSESVVSREGGLMAQGKLAAALEHQLMSNAVAAGGVRIGLTFVSVDGLYCRSFIADGNVQDLAGLACKNGGEWRLPLLVQYVRPASPGASRQAAVEMPQVVQDAIDQRSGAQPLDERGERDAMRKGWKR
ncbi:anti-sigma factor [Massilia sp. erpn]|uniref:anti-sigma factor family protein n=1 Tax=Massilia sp. erpn TaxID=2738142 RepID=UPI0021036A7A|nr:hypothetical protein [Massilia sp. erpn]UTY56135.1 hypothetical protein HPQ68_02370 [Massilia sp. erpn]